MKPKIENYNDCHHPTMVHIMEGCSIMKRDICIKLYVQSPLKLREFDSTFCLLKDLQVRRRKEVLGFYKEKRREIKWQRAMAGPQNPQSKREPSGS